MLKYQTLRVYTGPSGPHMQYNDFLIKIRISFFHEQLVQPCLVIDLSKSRQIIAVYISLYTFLFFHWWQSYWGEFELWLESNRSLSYQHSNLNIDHFEWLLWRNYI